MAATTNVFAAGIFNGKGTFLPAKFDGLLPCSMHPIAVQVKPVAAAGVSLYPETVNKEKKGFLLVWAEFWAIDPADSRRTYGPAVNAKIKTSPLCL